MNFTRFQMPGRLLVAAMAFSIAACSEPLTSPSTDFDLVARGLASANAKPPTMERAIIDGTGMTTLYVTTGSFAYFADPPRVNVPAIPGTGVLNHVHVKFCKNTYKDYDLHQFSANFHYKAVAVDKEFDDTPDSPLDPGDKDHKQVNWDRSAASTILKGGGEGSFKFTGIPAGASLEVHYNYRTAAGKNYSIKTCTPVLNAPDLSVEAVDWPASAEVGVPTVFQSTIGVIGISGVPAMARCAIYENDVLLGTSPLINVSSLSGEYCDVTITFTSGGSHPLVVKIEEISPSDFDLTNNTDTGVVGVGGGGGGGGEAPILATKITNPTPLQTMSEQWDKSGVVPVRTSWANSQNMKLIMQFKFTEFPGATSIIVSATTDDRVLQAPLTITGTGPCIDQSDAFPVSYWVRLCSAGEDVIFIYQVNASESSTSTTLGGTFVPWGSSVTFNVTIINGGYSYTLPSSALTIPLRTVSTTPCGVMPASDCSMSGVNYQVRSDGDSWLENITGITGVRVP